MKRLKTNKHILHVLKNSKAKLRNAIIKSSHTDVIKTICEICLNTLNGNHTLKSKDKTKLKKYKNQIRNWAAPKLSLSSKRKILVQKGGFLPILISSILSGVLGKLINSTT